MRTITHKAAIAERLSRSALFSPLPDACSVTRHLVGVQAQMLASAGLSIAARTRGFTATMLETGLHADRTLIKLWGQRGTLHLYPAVDWPLLHGACFTGQTWWERRVVRRGGDVEAYRAAVERVAALLKARGVLSRDDVRSAALDLPDGMLSSWGGVFADLVRRGIACHAGTQQATGRFAHREWWLPELSWSPPPSREANMAWCRGYLQAYGPATLKDLAYWRGVSLRKTRDWLSGLSQEVDTLDVEGTPMLTLKGDEVTPQETWPLRLLHRFDPLLLAHRDKSWLIDPDQRGRVWRPAGHIEPVILIRGRIEGTWRYRRRAKAIDLEMAPFGRLSKTQRREVEAEAARIAAHFEVPLGALDFVAA